MTPSTTVPTPRLVWVDSARALAVVAVVLFHVTIWHVEPHVAVHDYPRSVVLTTDGWAKMNGVVNGLRMPLLLGISGFLMSRRLQAGDGQATFMGVATNLWLYDVWLGAFGLASIWLRPGVPHRIESVGDWIWQFVVPQTPLWYLLALAMYASLVFVTRRLPTSLVVTALALLSIASAQGDEESLGMWRRIGILGVYFAVGARLPSRIRSAAEKASPWRSVFAVVIIVAMIYLDRFAQFPVLDHGYDLARNMVALFASVTLVSWVTRWRPLGRIASAVGKRTLPIYVLHILLIQVLVSLTVAFPTLRAPLTGPLLTAAYPVVMTIVLTLGCLGISHLLRRLGATWLFRLPPFATRPRRVTREGVSGRNASSHRRETNDEGHGRGDRWPRDGREAPSPTMNS